MDSVIARLWEEYIEYSGRRNQHRVMGIEMKSIVFAVLSLFRYYCNNTIRSEHLLSLLQPVTMVPPQQCLPPLSI